MGSVQSDPWRVLAGAQVVCAPDEVAATVGRLAAEVTARLAREHPLVLVVMRGSVVFAGQLLPLLRFPLELDYLDVTRYGKETRGGGITWRTQPATPVAGRVVLVIDDILDEGHTLAAIRDWVVASGAAACYTVVFADKALGRTKPIAADFVGVVVPDRYVFGFGMDVRGAWRNLPAIYAVGDDDVGQG